MKKPRTPYTRTRKLPYIFHKRQCWERGWHVLNTEKKYLKHSQCFKSLKCLNTFRSDTLSNSRVLRYRSVLYVKPDIHYLVQPAYMIIAIQVSTQPIQLGFS